MSLSEYLSSHSLSQRALADRLSVHESQVSRWLRGSVPSPATIARIQRLTGGLVTLSDWIGGDRG